MSDLDNHLDGGQRGGDVLRVRRSHRDGNAAGVQAAVEGCDQVNTCRTHRVRGSVSAQFSFRSTSKCYSVGSSSL